MHLDCLFSQPSEASNFDCESEKAIRAMSLVNYWITHLFKIANCNGFHFNAYSLGLQSNGILHVFIMLYDLHTCMYIHYYDDINMHADVDAQLLYVLFGLMDYLQLNLKYKPAAVTLVTIVFHNSSSIFTYLLLHFIVHPSYTLVSPPSFLFL